MPVLVQEFITSKVDASWLTLFDVSYPMNFSPVQKVLRRCNGLDSCCKNLIEFWVSDLLKLLLIFNPRF